MGIRKAQLTRYRLANDITLLLNPFENMTKVVYLCPRKKALLINKLFRNPRRNPDLRFKVPELARFWLDL